MTPCPRCNGTVLQEYDEEPVCANCGWRDRSDAKPAIVKEPPPRRDVLRIYARMWWLTGMTQADLARSMGVDRRTVSNYLRGPL